MEHFDTEICNCHNLVQLVKQSNNQRMCIRYGDSVDTLLRRTPASSP